MLCLLVHFITGSLLMQELSRMAIHLELVCEVCAYTQDFGGSLDSRGGRQFN